MTYKLVKGGNMSTVPHLKISPRIECSGQDKSYMHYSLDPSLTDHLLVSTFIFP